MMYTFYFVTFSDINNGVPHHAVAGPFYTRKSSELHRAIHIGAMPGIEPNRLPLTPKSKGLCGLQTNYHAFSNKVKKK